MLVCEPKKKGPAPRPVSNAAALSRGQQRMADRLGLAVTRREELPAEAPSELNGPGVVDLPRGADAVPDASIENSSARLGGNPLSEYDSCVVVPPAVAVETRPVKHALAETTAGVASTRWHVPPPGDGTVAVVAVGGTLPEPCWLGAERRRNLGRDLTSVA